VAAQPATAAGARFWLPPGAAAVDVSGFAIRGGMVYVGRGLPGPHGKDTEPSLIDPDLEARFWPAGPGGRPAPNSRHAQLSRQIPVHRQVVSYAKLTPDARATYLQWLSAGRTGMVAPGLVLLFLTGLERRVLGDLARTGAPEEYAAIGVELRRILSHYGRHPVLYRQASGLLTATETIGLTRSAAITPPIPDDEHHADLPPAVKVGVARFVAAGMPLPGDWAFSWHGHHPDRGWRAPATRCREEFTNLFGMRYKQTFPPAGLIVPAEGPELILSYMPANPGFGGQRVSLHTGLPDISRNPSVYVLHELAERAQAELDAYSRLLGRKPQARGTNEAFELLPAGLVRPTTPDARKLAEWCTTRFVDRDMLIVPYADLVALLPATAGSPAVNLTVALERRGFGIEPDARFLDVPPGSDDEVAVFRRGFGPTARPTAVLASATALLRLAVTVDAAGGQVSGKPAEDVGWFGPVQRGRASEAARGGGAAWSRRDVPRHVPLALTDPHALADGLGLSAEERTRLVARSMLLTRRPPRLADAMDRLEGLNPRQRGATADLIVAVAGASGRLEPPDLQLLLEIFQLLDFEEKELWRRLASLGADLEEATHPGREDPVLLDVGLVRQRLAETVGIAALLSLPFEDAIGGPRAIQGGDR
jgi:hypothetical protein